MEILTYSHKKNFLLPNNSNSILSLGRVQYHNLCNYKPPHYPLDKGLLTIEMIAYVLNPTLGTPSVGIIPRQITQFMLSCRSSSYRIPGSITSDSIMYHSRTCSSALQASRFSDSTVCTELLLCMC